MNQHYDASDPVLKIVKGYIGVHPKCHICFFVTPKAYLHFYSTIRSRNTCISISTGVKQV